MSSPSVQHLYCISPVYSVQHPYCISPVTSVQHPYSISPVPSVQHPYCISPVPSVQHPYCITPVPSVQHLYSISPVPSVQHLYCISPVPSVQHLYCISPVIIDNHKALIHYALLYVFPSLCPCHHHVPCSWKFIKTTSLDTVTMNSHTCVKGKEQLYRCLFVCILWVGSLPSSVELKSEWIYTSSPTSSLMTCKRPTANSWLQFSVWTVAQTYSDVQRCEV